MEGFALMHKPNCELSVLQMRRLLGGPARASPVVKRSRKRLLRALSALLAAVVLAFAFWAYADTAGTRSLPVKSNPESVDYGQLANVVPAKDVFASDSLSSQLTSYVLPNFKLQHPDWQLTDTLVNMSCPVKYKRLT